MFKYNRFYVEKIAWFDYKVMYRFKYQSWCIASFWTRFGALKLYTKLQNWLDHKQLIEKDEVNYDEHCKNIKLYNPNNV